MASPENPRQPGAWQEAVLVLLRMAIGWHFLYEGLVKILTPGWTSAPFLAESRWLLSGAFHWIASHPAALRVVDLLNVWGLVLIGLALLVGAFSRFAAVSGVVLLGLYYVASPPLAGLPANGGAEGSYLIVNKNLVEILALCVVAAFPARGFFGLERALARLFPRLRRAPRRHDGGRRPAARPLAPRAHRRRGRPPGARRLRLRRPPQARVRQLRGETPPLGRRRRGRGLAARPSRPSSTRASRS